MEHGQWAHDHIAVGREPPNMEGDAKFGHRGPKVDVLPRKRIRYLFLGIGLADSP